MVVRVLLFSVGKPPRLVEIPNTLVAAQLLVQGSLDAICLKEGIVLYRNDKGEASGLDLNFLSPQGGPIFGPCFFARVNDEGDMLSLTNEDVEIYAPSLTKGAK